MSIWTSVITTCFVMFSACQSSYDSIPSSLKLPVECQRSAAGYDDENDIVLILGGSSVSQQFIQFKNNEFIYHNTSYLPSTQGISGNGQHYFQLNDTLWIFNAIGTQFITVGTHPPYEVTIPDITIPIAVDNNGCLAMKPHHIFVVGGETAAKCTAHAYVQIFDMIRGEWLSGVPSLPAARSTMACYAIHDTLYAIGGIDYGCSQTYDSILTLNVSDAALSDISSQRWQVTTATINTPSRSLRVVNHRNDLIVIGGLDQNQNMLKDVNIINTRTGSCVLAGALSNAARSAACVLQRNSNILYLFGGGEPSFDSWQYVELPTVDPTTDPTNSPIVDSTKDPTNVPTVDPTTDPTNSPIQFSTKPSLNPTTLPTVDPTTDPIKSHTTKPTLYPSLPPTDIPTISEATMKETLYVASRTTTEYVEMTRDTIGATENRKSTKQNRALIIDEWATVLIVVCVSLCLIIVIVVIIGAIFTKQKNERLKPEIKKLELCTSNQKVVSKLNVAERDNVSHEGSTDSNSFLVLCEKVNEGKVTTAAGDVTIRAMIQDKIVLGIMSTKKGLAAVVPQNGERGEKDDIERPNAGEESSCSDSLYGTQATTRASDAPSVQNPMDFMKNVDASDMEEGNCDTTK